MLGGIKWSILYRQALIQKSNAKSGHFLIP
jgi:hypothetical protein